MKTRIQRENNQIRSQGQRETQAIQNELRSLEEQKNMMERQIEMKRIALQDKQMEIQQEIDGKEWEMQSGNLQYL